MSNAPINYEDFKRKRSWTHYAKVTALAMVLLAAILLAAYTFFPSIILGSGIILGLSVRHLAELFLPKTDCQKKYQEHLQSFENPSNECLANSIHVDALDGFGSARKRQ